MDATLDKVTLASKNYAYGLTGLQFVSDGATPGCPVLFISNLMTLSV